MAKVGLTVEDTLDENGQASFTLTPDFEVPDDGTIEVTPAQKVIVLMIFMMRNEPLFNIALAMLESSVQTLRDSDT